MLFMTYIIYVCLFRLHQQLVIILFSNVNHMLEEQGEVHLTHKTDPSQHAQRSRISLGLLDSLRR